MPFTICIRCNENTIKEIAPGYSNINSALKNSIYIQKHCETQFNQYDIDISSRKGIHEIIVMGFDNLYDIDKHGFITNGHGKGYSIFPQNETIETDKGKLLSLINIESLYFLNSQSYWAYKNEGREKYLQMDELEKGVLSGIKYCTYNKNYKKAKKKEIDFLFMAHCNMAYFETARKIVTCTRYWAAAIYNYDFTSVDFSLFITIFDSDSKSSTTDKIIKIIPKHPNPNSDNNKEFWSKTSSILAYDMNYFDKLEKLVYLLLKYFLRNLKYHYPIIKHIRENQIEDKDTGKPYFINLFEFIQFVKNHKGYEKFPAIQRICNQILSLVNPAIKKNFGLPLFNSEDLNKKKQSLNVFFPKSIKSFKKIFTDIEITNLLSLEQSNSKRFRPKWEYFIVQYFKYANQFTNLHH